MLRSTVTLGTLALLVGFASSARASLVITEIMSSSGTNGTGDWFEVTNNGLADVNITGYKMDDSSFGVPTTAEVALTGVTTIPANTAAVFLESATVGAEAADVTAFRTFWGGAATTALIGSYSGSGVGLSATSDGVTVFDASGTEIPGIRVSFGAASTGKSFDYAGGVAAGYSQVGVDGAYTSANALANVGSPGIAPEPASLAALGLMGSFAIRRRSAR